MMKVNLTKSLLLLCVGTAVLTYSCSQDDIYEDMEEEYVRSLAKRSMDGTWEDQTEPINGVYKLKAGEATGKTLDGVLKVTLKWGEGNLTRITPDPDVSVSLVDPTKLIRDILTDFVSWNSSVGPSVNAFGTVKYDLGTLERVRNVKGEIIRIDTVWKENQSTNFNIGVDASKLLKIDDNW